ncbi:MAG: hypothetical protein RL701_1827 [Pseudomonadota bacterium]|jgi:hypothetical protein
MTQLSTNLRDPAVRPYFLWDEKTTVAEFRSAIELAQPHEWARLVGKMMREARDTDVWHFVSPREVWRHRAQLDRYLGRRRDFWHYLLDGWNRDGFLGQDGE